MSELKWRRVSVYEYLPSGTYFYGGDGPKPVKNPKLLDVGNGVRVVGGDWIAGPVEIADPDPEPVQVHGCSPPIVEDVSENWMCRSPDLDLQFNVVVCSAPTQAAAIEGHNAAAEIVNANGGV